MHNALSPQKIKENQFSSCNTRGQRNGAYIFKPNVFLGLVFCRGQEGVWIFFLKCYLN